MPFLIVIFIILVFCLTVYLKHPTTRGKQGERRVRRVVGETVEGEKYVIHDLILDKGNGKTAQIDHIVINSRGVFVIETKNLSGNIYGSENHGQWTQVLANGRVKNKLYNPLKQNATHVYHVRRLLGNLPVHSLVVFVQNNTAYINAENVIPLTDLNYRLWCGVSVLSAEQMRWAYDTLSSRASAASAEEHVQNVLTQQEELRQGICPRCGGKLILRYGKYGAFYGCSNFPQCKFRKTL